MPRGNYVQNRRDKLRKERVAAHEYYKVPHTTTGLFAHKTVPISFMHTVDDFGVNYIGREHGEHLMSVFKQHYKMKEDWKGE